MIYYSYHVLFLALICYVHFASASVLPHSLPNIAPTTMAPPTATDIKVVVISSSTNPSAELLTKVPFTSETSLMFFFEGAGYSIWNILEENPPLGSAPINTKVVTLGGAPPRIPTLANLLLQLLAPYVSVVLSGRLHPLL